jgi:hypothetical protein
MKRGNPMQTKRVRWLVVVALAASSHAADARTFVPGDADMTCTADVKGWRAPGTAAADGIVGTPDNLGFRPSEDCDFYRQAMQMFLWLTSPVASNGGRASRVFNSSYFYDVSPLDASKQRELSRGAPDKNKTLDIRLAPSGPAGTPVIFDKSGRIHPFAGRTYNPVLIGGAASY